MTEADVQAMSANIQSAQHAMREATDEVRRQRIIIETYRRQDAEHEKLIGELYRLLKQEDLDGAMDLVRDAYLAIHGPSDD